MSKQARDKHNFNSMRGSRAGGQRRVTQETVSGTFVILSHHQCRDVVMILKSRGPDFLGPLNYSKNVIDNLILLFKCQKTGGARPNLSS